MGQLLQTLGVKIEEPVPQGFQVRQAAGIPALPSLQALMLSAPNRMQQAVSQTELIPQRLTNAETHAQSERYPQSEVTD